MRIVLLLLLASSTSYAEPYKRKAAVPEAKHVERKKPAPVKTEKPTADAILAGEILGEGVRVQQEHVLQQLADETPDSDPDKPEILFRLAEHYSRQLLYWRLREGANQ
jgi:hypothetical protein